jgi:hypothetical protein
MLNYENWIVIPFYWEKVFVEMKELSFDVVDLLLIKFSALKLKKEIRKIFHGFRRCKK